MGNPPSHKAMADEGCVWIFRELLLLGFHGGDESFVFSKESKGGIPKKKKEKKRIKTNRECFSTPVPPWDKQ